MLVGEHPRPGLGKGEGRLVGMLTRRAGGFLETSRLQHWHGAGCEGKARGDPGSSQAALLLLGVYHFLDCTQVHQGSC